MAGETLKSWKEAQQQIGSIVTRLNSNHSLMLAAAANPFFALEELGYSVSEDVRQEFEDRLRFGEVNGKQLHSLRQEVFKIAGKQIDLNSSADLFDTLTILLAETSVAALRKLQRSDVELLVPDVMTRAKRKDPLEKFRNAHPIMDPLLRYRAIEAGTPRFAERAVYDQIRRGARQLPITKIVARLQQKAKSGRGKELGNG